TDGSPAASNHGAGHPHGPGRDGRRADRGARHHPQPGLVGSLAEVGQPRGDIRRFEREFDEWQVELHGHRVIYRIAGSGPPVVLIHGMVNSSRHWEEVALRLADSYTVVAPDLIGHGDSATPRGDYSLGAHAAVIRDLLASIGIDRASIVGHSLGGGVAMIFFYHFPQRTERLALISAGGLGPEVSPLLRTAALPGAAAMLSLIASPRLVGRIDP